jgi:probable LLM family oxidoreductase
MVQALDFGLDTFGDVTEGTDGALKSAGQVIREVVDEAVLADQLGINFFGVGEHHRADFAVSAPEVVLAAIAAKTTTLRLGSAVTVLSSDDPVRVFQRFSTLDAISGGRAEVILGRGSFTESFPLFGYDLAQYNELFEEKIGLFAELLKEGEVTWRGTTRAGLTNQAVYPRTESAHLTTWVGVGGSPESVVRAARFQMPLALAIIGGNPKRFGSLVELYHRSLESVGSEMLPVCVHSPGYVAATDELAQEEFFPYMKLQRDRIGAERGWGPMTRSSFDAEVGERGSFYVGSPETVARKIAATAGALGIARFDLKYSNGRMPHDKLMRSIELYGREVVPLVHEMMAERVHSLP